MSELCRYRLVYAGRCQGVGFRWVAQRVALSLGLTGWVRNEDDGTVTLEIQGTDELIQEFRLHQRKHYAGTPIDFWVDTETKLQPLSKERSFNVKY